MEPIPSFIQKGQSDIQSWLLTEDHCREDFSNVDVLTANRGDVDTQVNESIAKLGLVVVIEILKGKGDGREAVSGMIDMEVFLTVTENVLVHRESATWTGKTAQWVVQALFDAFNPQIGKSLPCVLQAFETLTDTGNMLVFQVTGKTKAGWKKVPPATS